MKDWENQSRECFGAQDRWCFLIKFEYLVTASCRLGVSSDPAYWPPLTPLGWACLRSVSSNIVFHEADLLDTIFYSFIKSYSHSIVYGEHLFISKVLSDFNNSRIFDLFFPSSKSLAWPWKFFLSVPER